MKKLAIILMTLALLAGSAMAGKPVPEKPEAPYPNLRADFTHEEYGTECFEEAEDDVMSYNVIAAGDSYSGQLRSGDVDWFTFFVPADGTYTLAAAEYDENSVSNVLMFLYAECTEDPEDMYAFAYYLDLGYGAITEDLAAGTYYLALATFEGLAGTYMLTASEILPPPPAPDNDVCTGAIDLQEQGLITFDVDLAEGGYTNQSAMGAGGCTGYTTHSPEAFFKISLAAGESFIVTEDGDCDMALYLFTDCADPYASCVAGSDNCCNGAQELINYTAEAAGVYYLAVDAYYGWGCPVTVTINTPVATENTAFGTLKAMYR